MPWNPFRNQNRPSKRVEQPHSYEEQCAAEVKKVGFDLDFEFTPDEHNEALVKELHTISVRTFWADNPIEGKIGESQMRPQDREELHQQYIRKEEILTQHRDELRVYLQPYESSAKAWWNKRTSGIDVEDI
jgi:hypothetical protein